jgi:hypothetical protein
LLKYRVLADLHATLNRAVTVASGWDDPDAATTRKDSH